MFLRKLLLFLPPFNYITLHYLYFIVTILLFSVIFWLSSSPGQAVKYIDCLFMVTSAMTETGLNTVNLSQLNTAQQVLLFLLMLGGSSIFVSYFVVLVRKRAFESRFSELVEVYKTDKRDKTRNDINGLHRLFRSSNHFQDQHRSVLAFSENETRLSSSTPTLHNLLPESERRCSIDDRLQANTIAVPSPQTAPPAIVQKEVITLNLGVARGAAKLRTDDYLIIESNEEGFGSTSSKDPPHVLRKLSPAFSYPSAPSEDITSRSGDELQQHSANTCKRRDGVDGQVTLDNNIREFASFSVPIDDLLSSNVSNPDSRITREDRMQLGGSEYMAIKLLAYLIPAYFITWQMIGCLSATLYIVARCGDITKSNAINPWWLGIFLGVSAFTNCGLSLLDAGMTPFGSDTYLLVTFSVLIMAGNIAYPIVLRSLLLLLHHTLPRSEKYQSWNETIQFILEYPRRVYTNIFPAAHTWWLLFALLFLTGVDWLSFNLLNLANPAVMSIPFSFRQTIGFFQSISIRSAGFSIVPIGVLAVGTQVISVVMMYISAYPVLIPLRSSNVYEERSLGIYKGDSQTKKPEKVAENKMRSTMSRLGIETKLFFLRQQLQHQLAHDIWWLTISIVLIVCFETNNNNRDPVTYSVFNMIFEVVSAYGPVGLSTGLPNESYSLSGGFHTVSKVLICAVMIRGRHRGLPVAIDKAVLLPSEISDRGEGVPHLLHRSA